MLKKEEKYTCSHCKKTYKKVRADEECWEELKQLMPEAINDPIDVLCDVCWKEFMKWFNQLSADDKKKMRDIK